MWLIWTDSKAITTQSIFALSAPILCLISQTHTISVDLGACLRFNNPFDVRMSAVMSLFKGFSVRFWPPNEFS